MRLRRFLVSILIVIVGASVSSPAFAESGDGPETLENEPIEFFTGVRGAGTGNSHTAVASGVDSLYQNPAGVARAPMYVLDGAFTFTPQGALMSAGVVDSKLNPQLAAGVGYTYFIGRGEHENLSGHDVKAAIGIPVVPEQISVGAGIRYLRITDTDLPEPTGEDDEDAQLLIHGVTIDAGVNFQAADIFHLGLTGENLIDHCSDDERCRGSTPTRISGGVGIGEETGFMFSGDVSLDLTSSTEGPLFDFGAGAEYLVAGVVPLRLGYEHRAFLDRHLISAGGGWRSEEVGVDLAYRHDLNQADRFGYASASFSVYF